MSWQQILAENYRSLEALIHYLELPPHLINALDQNPSFSLSVPKRLAQKMQKATLDDPLVRQFIPLREENIPHSSMSNDPLQESCFLHTKKLIQKYAQRALIITTSACSMHCRFCFRRCFDFPKQQNHFDEEIEWINKHPEIHEIILSGGDPLSLNDTSLKRLFQSLSHISHCTTVRIHTRFPIGIPERIDPSFLTTLDSLPQQKIVVLHVNHPLELDDDVKEAMHRLHAKGIILLSQTVLLKGVNDTLTTLEALMKRLINCHIIPYYLHQVDQVPGVCHFNVPQEKGKELLDNLRNRLPGYCIPRYVQEIPFEKRKTPLC